PKNGPLDSQRTKTRDRFFRRPLVKIERHLSNGSRRTPVSRAVWDQYLEIVLKRLHLMIEGVDAIPPAAMQKNQRRPAPKLPVVNRDGTELRRMGRTKQLNRRHLSFPLEGRRCFRKQFRAFRKWIHEPCTVRQSFHRLKACAWQIPPGGFAGIETAELTYSNPKTKTAGSSRCQPFQLSPVNLSQLPVPTAAMPSAAVESTSTMRATAGAGTATAMETTASRPAPNSSAAGNPASTGKSRRSA